MVSETPTLKRPCSPEEWEARVHLAALYRLVALEGWDDLIFTHISARVPGPEHHFLINRYGMTFDEITASSLVKVDLDGHPVDEPDAPVNPAGFTIHSAIHMSREDGNFVIHLHTDHGVAVSMLADGLIPASQTALTAHGFLSYHDYEGVAVNLDERQRLVRDLGDNYTMILRNHGTLAVGPDAASAWLAIFFLERACKMQTIAQATGRELITLNEALIEKTRGQSRALYDGRFGPRVMPTLLRKLDRVDPGFRH